MRHAMVWAVCLVLAVISGGCLVGSSSKETRSGNYVPPATFDQIRPGRTTEGWVLATLGQPSQRTVLEDRTEVWKWSYTEHRSSSGHIFLLFSGSSQREDDRAAFVEIREGVVVKKWRT
jgi:outer membrane protein assembly factor BamE (lipoprotein component of BamABCDE complex)